MSDAAETTSVSGLGLEAAQGEQEHGARRGGGLGELVGDWIGGLVARS